MSYYYKVAVLIDAGFFRVRYRSVHKKQPLVPDLQVFIGQIFQKLQALNNANENDILHRIFYYECRPFGNEVTRPDGVKIDFSKTPQFVSATRLLSNLQNYPQLALRLGELSFDGWKVDPKNPSGPPLPDFKQKSVDMKIGLDMAWMASKRIVDKIVVVTADSDFVSPMKFARKEGLLVYLEPMGQSQLKMGLKEHADFVL